MFVLAQLPTFEDDQPLFTELTEMGAVQVTAKFLTIGILITVVVVLQNPLFLLALPYIFSEPYDRDEGVTSAMMAKIDELGPEAAEWSFLLLHLGNGDTHDPHTVLSRLKSRSGC